MIKLHVWLRLPDGDVLRAGELRAEDPDVRHGGRLRGAFRYHPAYLDHGRAFALDPLNLPLDARDREAERPRAGVHGVFEDSLPDDWGRALLIRRYNLPRDRHAPPYLLRAMGARCLGALAYTEQPHWTSDQAPSDTDLAALVKAAEAFDRDPSRIPDDQLALLFQAGSSPGGARPKVLAEHEGSQWLVKLRSSRDTVNMVRTEAACLALAAKAGLEVPPNRVETLGTRDALLIGRFDVTPQGGRHHLISFQTLLAAEGYYQKGYADLADIVRRVSSRPRTDLEALYRQMAFNAFLGNTDDHLKNFSMLRDAHGWRLTPAYDLVPDIPYRGEHVLHFGNAGQYPTAAALTEMGRAFGLSVKRGRTIISEVTAAFVGWRELFHSLGMSDADMGQLGDIDRRYERLNAAGS